VAEIADSIPRKQVDINAGGRVSERFEQALEHGKFYTLTRQN
jgi:hypothetical protein